MKQYWSLGLVLILVFCLAACTGQKETTASDTEPAATTAQPTTPAPTEEPTDALVPPEPVETSAVPEEKDAFLGTWYGLVEGGAIRLDLTDDMKYTVHFLNGDEADHEGTWAVQDGLVTLDGEEKPSFSLNEQSGALYWADAEVFLSREEPDLYTPAELLEELPENAFDGYWKSAYVAADGLIVPSELVGDQTDVYIKGTQAALGGPLFGDFITTLEEDGSALIAKAGGSAEARFEMQEDLMLRLTLRFEEGDLLVIYLTREPIPEE